MSLQSSYPSKRRASTTDNTNNVNSFFFVVIPFQTKGFYNRLYGCVSYSLFVVIPFQTKGFYNNKQQQQQHHFQSSYPSKRRASTTITCNKKTKIMRSSYPSKRRASTTWLGIKGRRSPRVVIPFQTKGFYNSVVELMSVCKLGRHTLPNEGLLQPFGNKEDAAFAIER